MREKVIAGNWKMHNDLHESVNLISGIKNLLNETEFNSKVIICPPFTSLETSNELIKGGKIRLGAQNMHFEDKGAFTGEISGEMLKSIGCEYVIIGHSERRKIFGETDEEINKKILKATYLELIPIFCVGETLEEREKGITEKVVENQLRKGLENLKLANSDRLIIAYEPVWAIGTGKTATPDQAQDVHKFIRGLVAEVFSENVSQNIIILYGGSVKPENSADLLSKPDIDGALVGGACLKAESFVSIIASA
jgi:triosephosphate isomerase